MQGSGCATYIIHVQIYLILAFHSLLAEVDGRRFPTFSFFRKWNNLVGCHAASRQLARPLCPASQRDWVVGAEIRTWPDAHTAYISLIQSTDRRVAGVSGAPAFTYSDAVSHW